MKILAIDYGRAKLGLALAESKIAEPYSVIRYRDIKILREKLKEIIKKNRIDKVVVGISEGKMGEEARAFSLSLRKILSIPIDTFDETLTTQDAQKKAIEAGVKRKRRKGLEDAYAAAIILENYLDQYERAI